jgi:hypothetical protein
MVTPDDVDILEIVVTGKVSLPKDFLTIAIDAADVGGGHPCGFQPVLTFPNLSAGMTPFFARKSMSGKYDIPRSEVALRTICSDFRIDLINAKRHHNDPLPLCIRSPPVSLDCPLKV